MAETWRRCRLLGNSRAEVYLAVDEVTGHLFVVKTTDTAEISTTSELLNEITIYLLLNSPRVVKYLGSCFSQEVDKIRLNLFVEFMPGGTLRNHIKRLGPGSLCEALIRTYTRSILEALHHLHSHGIVHGDVKADNVFVGLYEIKLADFGGSKFVGVKKSMKGTCAWMAPEVVAGYEQGQPSDIWSLGCTIVEMATGLDPWPKLATNKDIRRVIQHSNRTPDIPLTLSFEGQQFLKKCFERNPTKRAVTSELLEENFLTPQFQSPVSKTPLSLDRKTTDPPTKLSRDKTPDPPTKLPRDKSLSKSGTTTKEEQVPNTGSFEREDHHQSNTLTSIEDGYQVAGCSSNTNVETLSTNHELSSGANTGTSYTGDVCTEQCCNSNIKSDQVHDLPSGATGTSFSGDICTEECCSSHMECDLVHNLPLFEAHSPSIQACCAELEYLKTLGLTKSEMNTVHHILRNATKSCPVAIP